VLLTVLAGTVMAAIVGGLLAIPVLRLGGIYLALATLAFAMMFDSILFPLDWVGGGLIPLKVPRPEFIEGDQEFFLFAVAVLIVVGTVVALVRRGSTGKYLDALRGSETAATAIGINAARWRVVAFALSAGIAGLGGGLLAMLEGQANYTSNFTPFAGLFWIVIVVTIGARTVEGAVIAALALALFPELLKELGVDAGIQYVLFGLGALTYARHPEGILEAQKRGALEWIDRMTQRRRGGGGDGAGAPKRDEPAAVDPVAPGPAGVGEAVRP
jgi:branched-chain amino acid transport system permease protein